jgi:FtsZ-binding cell division protein ZapB
MSKNTATKKGSTTKVEFPFTFLGIHFANYSLELAKTIDTLLAHKVDPTTPLKNGIYGFEPVEDHYLVNVPDNEHIQVFTTKEKEIRRLNVHCCQYGPQPNISKNDRPYYSYVKRDELTPAQCEEHWGIDCLPFVYIREKLQKWNIYLLDYNTMRRHKDGSFESKQGPCIELFFDPENIREIGRYESAFHGFHEHPEIGEKASEDNIMTAHRVFLTEVKEDLAEIIQYMEKSVKNFQTLHFSEEYKKPIEASPTSSTSSSAAPAPKADHVAITRDAPLKNGLSFAAVAAKTSEDLSWADAADDHASAKEAPKEIPTGLDGILASIDTLKKSKDSLGAENQKLRAENAALMEQLASVKKQLSKTEEEYKALLQAMITRLSK